MDLEVEGIVLRQVPYKEKDCMVTILTKDGIRSFMARGIASPTSKNASSCNLFSTSIFSLSQKGNKFSLKQGKLISSHYELMTSLEKMSALELCVEASIRFLDENNDFAYAFLTRLIELLIKDFDSKTLVAIYLAQIIKNSGYALEYKECVNCGSKQNIVKLSFNEGGFLCSNCAHLDKQNNQDNEYLNSFRYTFMVDVIKMDHYVINETYSLRLIDEYCRYLCTSFDLSGLKSLEIYKKSF